LTAATRIFWSRFLALWAINPKEPKISGRQRPDLKYQVVTFVRFYNHIFEKTFGYFALGTISIQQAYFIASQQQIPQKENHLLHG
jgi:hypothetical protein